ncbi:MAG: phosphate regulon sensor histidine kinase PhoR [Pseudomonadales bacterium]
MKTISAEIQIAVGICLLATSLGWFFSHTVIGLVIGLLIFVFYELRKLKQMARWLAREETQYPPHSRAVWSTMMDRVYHQRRRADQQFASLQSESEYMREALASLSDAVVMIDSDGSIEWCNNAAGQLLGLQYPRDKRQLLVNLLRDLEFVRYFNKGKYRKGLEIATPHKRNQRLRIEITIFGNNNRLLFARDVTAIKRMEQMRVDFVANVSHELRTPLTVIGGYLEAIQSMPFSEDALVSKALHQMTGQCTRMEHLVDDLMLLTRLESEGEADHSRNPINVAGMSALLAEDARIKLAADKQVTIDADVGLCLIGNEREIHSAFSNLVNNACKYTPAGGEIKVSWQEKGEWAVFSVRDTGIGIDRSQIPRLTERFYRVESSRSTAHGGTGLGLAIVKHVLIRHKGRLKIDSKVGEGSTFSCFFRLSQTARSKQD